MRKTLAILLASIFIVMACAVSVYADDDEGNEANEAGEGDSEDDEKENSVPGFEFAFAAGAALASARLIKARIL